MSDPIGKIADKLSAFTPEEKRLKRNHTIFVDHEKFVLLYAYCRRKGISIGDVVGDLIGSLLDSLNSKGELTIDDSERARKTIQSQLDREVKKRLKDYPEVAGEESEDPDTAATATPPTPTQTTINPTATVLPQKKAS